MGGGGRADGSPLLGDLGDAEAGERIRAGGQGGDGSGDPTRGFADGCLASRRARGSARWAPQWRQARSWQGSWSPPSLPSRSANWAEAVGVSWHSQDAMRLVLP